MIWRETARQDLKLACLQFENDRPWYSRFLPRRGPQLLCQAADHRVSFRQQDVFWERVLDRYGLRGPIRYNRILIDAACEFVEAHAVAAKLVLKFRELEASQLSDSLD